MRNKGQEIYYKTDDEVAFIKESCLIVSKVLAHCASRLKPGITGLQLDKEAEELIRDNGAVPGFKGYGGFPNTLCISVNEAVVHGIPNNQEFKEGDIISIDCGSFKNGFYGDAAFTFPLGQISLAEKELLETTKTSLYLAIEQAIVGQRVGDIGYAVQNYCEKKNGYGVVRKLVGHGIGRNLHESPEIPNFGKRGSGVKLKDGLVIAIEPMVNLGTKEVLQAEDGWTIITKDKKPSAHYEHTVVVRKNQAELLSNHEIVEKEIKNNENIMQISIKS